MLVYVPIYPPTPGNKRLKNKTMEKTRDVNAIVHRKKAYVPNNLPTQTWNPMTDELFDLLFKQNTRGNRLHNQDISFPTRMTHKLRLCRVSPRP